jgi:syntaxin 18
LNSYLKGIRQAYLSTAPPPRRTGVSSKDKQSKHLTDRQKEEVDAEAKQLIRQLEASIRNLADAELLSQQTDTTLIRKKYARLGLGALGSWAAGGAGQTKSHEQELDEAKADAIKTHREAVIWYLRQKIQQCSLFQAVMMEKRLRREMEKNKSALAKSRAPVPELGGFDNASIPPAKPSASAHLEAQQLDLELELSPEQIQIFEKENQDMLKHYASTLDQVRYVGTAPASRTILIILQNGREVAGRDSGVTNTACKQLGNTVGAHRSTRGRFLLYSRERWGW